MTRLRATLLVGLVLAAALGLAGATVRVPFVALGDGPTFDVLGQQGGRTIVDVTGPVPVFPTGGQLRMTTVSVTSQVTLLGAMALWVGGDRQVVPRESVYPTGQTRQEVDAENTRAFSQSETNAQDAALRFLGYPSTVAIGDVVPGGPAADRLLRGDRVLAVDGRPVATPQNVVDAVAPTAPGQTVTVRVARGGVPLDVPVVAAPRPSDAARGYLGVVPTDQVDSPARISISLGDVGGPSAGLVFATAIVDKLTPGDLTAGRTVAGTGTIDATGMVGPIGGIRFKLDAARRDGATAFLVPAGNCEEAVAEAPDGLTLARVADLGQGVAALEALRAGRAPTPC